MKDGKETSTQTCVGQTEQRHIAAQAHLGPKSKGRPLLTSNFNMKAAQNSDGLSTTRHGRL